MAYPFQLENRLRGVRRVISIAFLCCSAFSSLPAWSPPVSLSLSGQNSSNPQIAVNASGDAVAVWQTTWSISGQGEQESTIQASVKPSGGVWSAPETISLDVSHPYNYNPQVVIDSNGTITAVWEGYWSDNQTFCIQAATRSSGGSWQPPIQIAPADYTVGSSPQIGIDAAGDVVVVWATDVVVGACVCSGGSWGGVATLFQGNATSASVAMNADGDIVAVWQAQENYTVIQAASKPHGEGWQAAVTISSTNEDSVFPDVAIDADGNATAVWYLSSNSLVVSSSKARGGSWGPIVNWADYPCVSPPKIAVDLNGKATAVWPYYSEPEYCFYVLSFSKPFGGDWQDSPDTLSGGYPLWASQIAIGPSGNAVAAWVYGSSTYWNAPISFIQSSQRNYGGDWQAEADTISWPSGGLDSEQDMDSGSVGISIGIDSDGVATVVWPWFDGNSLIIQAASSEAPSTIITGITPHSGPEAGGTSVTISGSGFTGATEVFFGETPAASFSVESDETIVAVAPPGTGTVDVRVATPSGTSPITTADQYTYQKTAPQPPGWFTGSVKLRGEKVFLKTRWEASETSSVVQYEIFARELLVAVVSARDERKAMIRLWPHHIPHHISKDYRLYLHNKYKIRAVDATGAVSSYTQLDVEH